MNVNQTVVAGRLTADPEFKTVSNKEVVTYSIAVNEYDSKTKSYDKVTYINCVSFGKTAVAVSKFFHKGSNILTFGRIKNDKYKTKDGETKYSFGVIVDRVELVDPKQQDEDTLPF